MWKVKNPRNAGRIQKKIISCQAKIINVSREWDKIGLGTSIYKLAGDNRVSNTVEISSISSSPLV